MREDPNRARIEAVAVALGPLVNELCLVGGCATGLLITDPGADPVRPTMDVDLVVEALQYAEYAAFCERLRSRGFGPGGDPDDPICRWRQGELVIDLMPFEEGVLGFSNRWYRPAFESSHTLELTSGQVLRHVDGPHFLATKLDAYAGRGGGDAVMSHDLEDLVRVIDGRGTLLVEVSAAAEPLRQRVRDGIGALLRDRYFVEALSGYFTDGYERAPRALTRMRALAEA